jgi:hypothetical protein
MNDFKLSTYTWRGKTYKTITGLFKKIGSIYHTPGGYGMNFEADAMCLRPRTGPMLRFRRTFDADHNSVIADEPE